MEGQYGTSPRALGAGAYYLQVVATTMTEPRVTSSPALDARNRAAAEQVEAARPASVDGARIDEFDALRGIAILFAMWLHAYFDPWASVTRPELVTLHLTQLVANSAVPLFLFMSGVLAARDRHSDFPTAMLARGRRLALPLLFWMVAALFIEAWWAGAFTSGLLRSFALFDIEGQFYYVVVLLALSAVLYPLRYVDDRTLKWCVVAAFAANLAMIAWYSSHPLTGLWWTIAYRNPLVWVFAFTFGLYIGRTRGHVEFGRRATTAAAVGMALSAVAYLAIGEWGGGYPNSYFGVTVFLFGACGFVVYPAGVRALARGPVGRWVLTPFRALAPYAFGIYLVHQPYFVGAFSHWLVSDSPVQHYYLLLVWSLFAVGAAASIAFVVLANRLFPRFSALMLGVEASRAPSAPPALAVEVSRRLEPADVGRALRSAHWRSQTGRG